MNLGQKLILYLLLGVVAVFFFLSGSVLYLFVWPIGGVLGFFLPETAAFEIGGILGLGMFIAGIGFLAFRIAKL